MTIALARGEKMKLTTEQLRANFIQGLREMAQFYEENPAINPQGFCNDLRFTNYNFSTKEEFAMVAKTLGKCEKRFVDTIFTLEKTFGGEGGPMLQFVGRRDVICERVVVGKKTVPAVDVPAREAHTVPAQEIEEVEWRCGSILSPGESANV